ncbi:hypothetical protein EDB83DRAFT_2534618 [Lactarius deliciosus]|nr:hypothetical protein EDB83DRAFT_2534618 [Lactarius deliciosus]
MRYNVLSFALLLLSWWLLANVNVNFSDTTGHITFEHAWFDATNRRVAKLQLAFSFGAHANDGQAAGADAN